VERLDLAKIWQAPRRPGFYHVRNIPLTLLVAVFVFDALATRLGLRWKGSV